MTPDMIVVLLVLVGSLVLFVTERLPVDVVALLVLVTLTVTGILTPAEATAGFSNPATLTVGAMFLLSAAVSRTRVIQVVATRLTHLFQHRPRFALGTFMGGVAAASAFINNTAIVAVMIPVSLSICRRSGWPVSRLLMPLSFASLFGGVCSLIGTSTNVLVASIAAQHGIRFGMFDITPLGLITMVTGLAYMATVGYKLMPVRSHAQEFADDFDLDRYLTELVLLPGSPSVGRPLRNAPLVQELDLVILEIRRADGTRLQPGPDTLLEAGDLLRIRCNLERLHQIQNLRARLGAELAPERHWSDAELSDAGVALVEAVVSPSSYLNGRTLAEARFKTLYGGTVLAMRHRGDLVDELSTTVLCAGDVLLARIDRRRLDQLSSTPDLIVVSEMEAYRVSPRSVRVFLVLAGVVLAAAVDLAPIVVAALAGCLVLLLTGAITLPDAYRRTDWSVLLLLAGILPLGTAMEKTGVAELLSSGLVSMLGPWGPLALLSAFYLLTSILTECMSNNATAAVLCPIAVTTAQSLGVSPTPFLVAVMFGASASFVTPVGYQTNTMVYSAGGYHFSDFVRVGTPLNLLFWLLSTLLIPFFWPF